MQAVIDDGVTAVVAAGNTATDACAGSPGRLPTAITVGATDAADARASFSNVGTCLDLFAPGVAIPSAGLSSPTAMTTMSGTSMASPHAAGAAAVLLAQLPTLTPADVASRLIADATTGVVVGGGSGSPNRLLYAGPTGTATPPPPPPSPAPAAPVEPTAVRATAGVLSATVSWTQGNGGSPLTAQTIRVYSGKRVIGTASVSGAATSATVSGLQAGKGYSFTVIATNVVGSSRESAMSNSVTPTAAPSTGAGGGGGGGKPPKR
jgi:subtilisin family serine protease